MTWSGCPTVKPGCHSGMPTVSPEYWRILTFFSIFSAPSWNMNLPFTRYAGSTLCTRSTRLS